MDTMRLAPVAAAPDLRSRPRWTVAVSILLHGLALAALLLSWPRPQGDGLPAPSYELMFDNAGAAATSPAPAETPSPAPTASIQEPVPPAPTPPAPESPALRPAPDALAGPPAPATIAPPTPDAPVAQPDPAPPGPVAMLEPQPQLPPPSTEPIPQPPQPAPPSPVTETAPTTPAPVPEAAPPAAPPVVTEPAPSPAQASQMEVRLEPPAPLPPLVFTPVPIPEPPPTPAPAPPRPQAKPTPPRTAPAQPPATGSFANPMDLNFGPAAPRLAAPRLNAAPGSVASRSLDLSPGQIKAAPSRSGDPYFDIRAKNVSADWAAGLRAYWLSHRYYPRQAAEAGEDGAVDIEMTVNRNGRVEAVEVKGRSGSVWLDMAAVAIWRGVQLAPLPPEMEGATVKVPITIHYILIR